MYKLVLHELSGLPIFEATGRFTQADVWELVGEKNRVATFTFAPGSAAEVHVGRTIVGIPLYTPQERFSSGSTCGPNLRIDTIDRDVDPAIRRHLERQGASLQEIAGILFLPFGGSDERHETGEKKVPNVITIPYQHDPTVDVDRLTQNFLIMKHNEGVELAPFEKAQLIGLTLAFNDGIIDRRILEHFGFTVEQATDSPDICYHRLETKQRHCKPLTERETTQLDDLRAIKRMAAIIRVLEEIQACKLPEATSQVRSALETVLAAVQKFRPTVLLNGKRQVFWDLDAYVHIVLRHIKEMQIGGFEAKTPFPYRAEDLEQLIGKVLALVRDDIHAHFIDHLTNTFFRAGARSVYFNGDYYSFHIAGDGRLINFHPLGGPPRPG